MLVYEKDNKLNINFDNKVDDSPDLSIGKSGDKTQILIDGQESGSGSGANVLTLYGNDEDGLIKCYLDPSFETAYASYDEALSALNNADAVKIVLNLGIPDMEMSEVSAVSKFAVNGTAKQVGCIVIDMTSQEPAFMNAWLYLTSPAG